MCRFARYAVLPWLVLALVPASAFASESGPAGAEVLTREWEPPVSIGEDLFESDSALAPLGRVLSAQQRTSASAAARIGVTETDARTGALTDTALWSDRSVGYYPRVAVAPTGRAAVAFSDGQLLHIYLRKLDGEWAEVGAVHEGQTDYSDGRPLLAFTSLGHLVVAWPRKDSGGGQRVWLTELAPGSSELATPRPLDPQPNSNVVQVARDLAVGADGRVALAYLQGPSRTSGLTARVAFGRLGGDLDERHELPGTVSPWSWRAPQVDFDRTGGAAIAWHTVPGGFDQGAALGDLHLVLRRADGTLGATTELGQTPTGDGLDLGVSDLGEVLLGYDSAGNLSGSGGSWSYSFSGFRAALGSTLLGRMGKPETIVPWPGTDAHLAMNRRGDAVLAYTDCCLGGRGRVRALRRVPGGSFGDSVLVAEGELVPADENAFYGTWVHEVALDEIGNAMVTWSGFGPIPLGLTVSVDGPVLDVSLPGIPLGIDLPPVLPPLPDPSPTPQPSQPVITTPQELRRPPEAPRWPLVGEPLALSVAASKQRGVPRQLRLKVRCSRPCAVQASGRLVGAPLQAFRGYLPARRTTRLAIKLSPSVRRRLRARLRGRASTTARFAVTAASAGGASTSRAVRATLKRR